MSTQINLQQIARESLSFEEFHERVNETLENPAKYRKNQEAHVNVVAIAYSCITFGEFMDKLAEMNGQR
jgi:hypothetical protein